MFFLAAADSSRPASNGRHFSSITIKCLAGSRSALAKIAFGDCRFAYCSRWNRLRTNGSPRPYRERGRVRVLFEARIPLILILSPQARGEATKISVTSFNS